MESCCPDPIHPIRPRAHRPALAALLAAALLAFTPSVAAWERDPDDPTNLPVVNQVDPENPPDPDPIVVPMPVPVPETKVVGEWKILIMSQCFDFGCVYVDANASSQNQRACGGLLRTDARVDATLVGGPYAEAGNGRGVYGGYSSRCYEEGRGLTIDA